MYTLENQNPVCERNVGSSGAPGPSTHLYTLHQGQDLMPFSALLECMYQHFGDHHSSFWFKLELILLCQKDFLQYLIGDCGNLSLPCLLRFDHWQQFDHLDRRVLAHSQAASLQPAPPTGRPFHSIPFHSNSIPGFFKHFNNPWCRWVCAASWRPASTSA